MTPPRDPQRETVVRLDDDGFEWGGALIEVPDVGRVDDGPTALDAWERRWMERRREASARPIRRRRRLRREVRVAACIVLVFMPLATAIGAWGFPPARSLAAAESARPEGDDDAPMIRRSIKPMSGAGDGEPEPSVVLPGYLLPAEGREEASHEGS